MIAAIIYLACIYETYRREDAIFRSGIIAEQLPAISKEKALELKRAEFYIRIVQFATKFPAAVDGSTVKSLADKFMKIFVTLASIQPAFTELDAQKEIRAVFDVGQWPEGNEDILVGLYLDFDRQLNALVSNRIQQASDASDVRSMRIRWAEQAPAYLAIAVSSSYIPSAFRCISCCSKPSVQRSGSCGELSPWLIPFGSRCGRPTKSRSINTF